MILRILVISTLSISSVAAYAQKTHSAAPENRGDSDHIENYDDSIFQTAFDLDEIAKDKKHKADPFERNFKHALAAAKKAEMQKGKPSIFTETNVAYTLSHWENSDRAHWALLQFLGSYTEHVNFTGDRGDNARVQAAVSAQVATHYAMNLDNLFPTQKEMSELTGANARGPDKAATTQMTQTR